MVGGTSSADKTAACIMGIEAQLPKTSPHNLRRSAGG